MKTDARGRGEGQIPSDFLPADPGAQWAPALFAPPPQRPSWGWGVLGTLARPDSRRGSERRAGILRGAGQAWGGASISHVVVPTEWPLLGCVLGPAQPSETCPCGRPWGVLGVGGSVAFLLSHIRFLCEMKRATKPGGFHVSLLPGDSAQVPSRRSGRTFSRCRGPWTSSCPQARRPG